MGKLEEKNKKQIRATKIQEAILKTIGLAGFMSVALLAPNALKILRVFGLDKKLLRDKANSINNSRRRLVKNGLVEYSEGGLLSLTQKGERLLRKIEMNNFKVKKPLVWDKKWRVLIFDIKESHKQIRDNIRGKLGLIGFVKLQNSVWVYPYDCEDFINLLKAEFYLGREVLYIIADSIENEKVLLSHFKLGR